MNAVCVRSSGAAVGTIRRTCVEFRGRDSLDLVRAGPVPFCPSFATSQKVPDAVVFTVKKTQGLALSDGTVWDNSSPGFWGTAQQQQARELALKSTASSAKALLSNLIERPWTARRQPNAFCCSLHCRSVFPASTLLLFDVCSTL